MNLFTLLWLRQQVFYLITKCCPKDVGEGRLFDIFHQVYSIYLKCQWITLNIVCMFYSWNPILSASLCFQGCLNREYSRRQFLPEMDTVEYPGDWQFIIVTSVVQGNRYYPTFRWMLFVHNLARTSALSFGSSIHLNSFKSSQNLVQTFDFCPDRESRNDRKVKFILPLIPCSKYRSFWGPNWGPYWNVC